MSSKPSPADRVDVATSAAVESIAQPAVGAAEPQKQRTESSVDWALLGLFALVLVFVAASNVWLRLRAQGQSLTDLLAEWGITSRRRPRGDID